MYIYIGKETCEVKKRQLEVALEEQQKQHVELLSEHEKVCLFYHALASRQEVLMTHYQLLQQYNEQLANEHESLVNEVCLLCYSYYFIKLVLIIHNT